MRKIREKSEKGKTRTYVFARIMRACVCVPVCNNNNNNNEQLVVFLLYG